MNYDNLILMLINGFAGHWPLLDKLMVSVSKFGPLVFGIYLISMWFSGDDTMEREENQKRALYAVCSALLALGINQVIGAIWFRERPYLTRPVKVLMPITPDSSFPSDHAAGSFSLAGSIAFGRKIPGILLAIFAVVVTVSRIYVGAHYPTDVVGGMLIGLLSSWVVECHRNILNKFVIKIIDSWNIIEVKVVELVPNKILTK